MTKREKAIKWAAWTVSTSVTKDGRECRLAEADAWDKAKEVACGGTESANEWAAVLDAADGKGSGRAWTLLRSAFLREYASVWFGRDYLTLPARERPVFTSDEEALAALLGFGRVL